LGDEKLECDCSSEMEPMLEKVMEDGEIIVDYPEPEEIRDYLLDQLSKVEADWLE